MKKTKKNYIHEFCNKNRKVQGSLKIFCRGVVITGYSVRFEQYICIYIYIYIYIYTKLPVNAIVRLPHPWSGYS